MHKIAHSLFFIFTFFLCIFVEASNYYKLHDYFSPLRSKFLKDNSKNYTKIWTQYYQEQNDLLLDMQEARNIKGKADKIFLKKIEDRSQSIPELIKNSESALKNITSRLEINLSRLNQLTPFSQPIDIFYIFHPHPFNGKEFIYNQTPAFAINFSFPDLVRSINNDVLITHEAFHVLHLKNSSSELLNTSEGIIMREGLAVLATKLILKDTAEKEILFYDDNTYESCLKNYSWLKNDLNKKVIENNFAKINKLFFSTNTENEKYPPRCGYLISLHMAENLKKSLSIDELIKLPYKEYKDLVQNFLK